jgi:hypothetical protein
MIMHLSEYLLIYFVFHSKADEIAIGLRLSLIIRWTKSFKENVPEIYFTNHNTAYIVDKMIGK